MKDGRLPAACRLPLLCASAAAVINHGSLLEQELRPLKSSLRIFLLKHSRSRSILLLAVTIVNHFHY